jgi:hypothetical protein
LALRLTTCFFFGGPANGVAAAGVGTPPGLRFWHPGPRRGSSRRCGSRDNGGSACGEEVSARVPPLLDGGGAIMWATKVVDRAAGALGPASPAEVVSGHRYRRAGGQRGPCCRSWVGVAPWIKGRGKSPAVATQKLGRGMVTR